MVEVPVIIPLILLCVSLVATCWAVFPVRKHLVVQGRILRGSSSSIGLLIVCEVAGGQEFIAKPSSNGLFRVRLPLGCTARMKFFNRGGLMRIVMIEHRSGDQCLGREPHVIDLGEVTLDHPSGAQPVRTVVLLHDEFVTITDRYDPIRHAPFDRQLLDRHDHMIGMVRKAG